MYSIYIISCIWYLICILIVFLFTYCSFLGMPRKHVWPMMTSVWKHKDVIMFTEQQIHGCLKLLAWIKFRLTPPKFNSSPLKNDLLEDDPFLLKDGLFLGAMLLNFLGCTWGYSPEKPHIVQMSFAGSTPFPKGDFAKQNLPNGPKTNSTWEASTPPEKSSREGSFSCCLFNLVV